MRHKAPTMKSANISLLALLLTPLAALPAQERPRPLGADTVQSLEKLEDPNGERAWRTHGFTDAQRESLREAFRWGIENKFIPGGALLVIHRGEPVFREAFGVADLETGRPFTIDAPCRIASVTNSIFASH